MKTRKNPRHYKPSRNRAKETIDRFAEIDPQYAKVVHTIRAWFQRDRSSEGGWSWEYKVHLKRVKNRHLH